MTRDELVAEASKLETSAGSARAYEGAQLEMAAAVSRHLEARADLSGLIGSLENVEMMRDNHRNHAGFVAALLADFQAGVLVETLLWVVTTYRAHGFSAAYWPAQLNAWLSVMQDHLDAESFEEVRPLYAFLLAKMPAVSALVDLEAVELAR